jgi:uncharacterized protein involved in type VI secretion and phage assembly
MTSDFIPDGEAPRYFGLFPAIVTDLVDKKQMGRIQVKFLWLGNDGDSVRAWARLLTPYADQDQGFQMLPEVDSEVVVAFEAGDLRRPYIVGACWNGKEQLPASAQAANNKRLIKTRAGSVLEFDDTKGAPKVTVKTQRGHKLVLDDGAQQIAFTHANGSSITFTMAGQIQIQANSTLEITASAVNVHSAMAKFDGVVKCSALITQSVVSSSYTPGAGNVW